MGQACGDDDVFHPAGDEEIPLGAIAEIAAVHPAIAPGYGVRRFGVPEVALHHRWASEVYRSLLALAENLSCRRYDTDFVADKGCAAPDEHERVGVG